MKKYFWVLSIFIFPVSTYGINLQGFKFSDSYRYSFLEDAGLEEFSRPLTFYTSGAFINKPLYLTDSSSSTFRQDIIKNYSLLYFGFSYRIDENFKLGLESSIIRTKVFDKTKNNFGETKIKVKMLLMNQNDSKLSLTTSLHLPSGHQETFTSSGSIGGSFMATYEKKMRLLNVLAGIGYYHSDKNKFSIINYRNLALIEFGLSYDINSFWNFNAEINRNFTLATDKNQDAGSYYLSLKHKTMENLNTYLGTGISGFDNLGKNSWSIFSGIKSDF